MHVQRPKSSRPTSVAAGLLALSVLFTSGGAPAADLPVSVAATALGNGTPAVERELRSLLRAELTSAEFSRVRTRTHYVLSATLVRLDSIQAGESARATCVVSVAVLRDGSTLHALINGRATAEQAQAPAARSDALRAAVHSAMKRVPNALR